MFRDKRFSFDSIGAFAYLAYLSRELAYVGQLKKELKHKLNVSLAFTRSYTDFEFLGDQIRLLVYSPWDRGIFVVFIFYS